MSKTTNMARSLRTNPTEAEKTLWKQIRNKSLGYKFRRQFPLIFEYDNTKHCFIADFICLEKKFVIELDGEVHSRQKDYDSLRSILINSLGYNVYRFHNSEVMTCLEQVVEQIRNYCCPHPAFGSLPCECGEGLGMGAKQGGDGGTSNA